MMRLCLDWGVTAPKELETQSLQVVFSIQGAFSYLFFAMKIDELLNNKRPGEMGLSGLARFASLRWVDGLGAKSQREEQF